MQRHMVRIAFSIALITLTFLCNSFKLLRILLLLKCLIGIISLYLILVFVIILMVMIAWLRCLTKDCGVELIEALLEGAFMCLEHLCQHCTSFINLFLYWHLIVVYSLDCFDQIIHLIVLWLKLIFYLCFLQHHIVKIILFLLDCDIDFNEL